MSFSLALDFSKLAASSIVTSTPGSFSYLSFHFWLWCPHGGAGALAKGGPVFGHRAAAPSSPCLAAPEPLEALNPKTVIFR